MVLSQNVICISTPNQSTLIIYMRWDEVDLLLNSDVLGKFNTVYIFFKRPSAHKSTF